MTTATLPTSLSFPPFLRRRGQPPKMASPSVYCEVCGQPLYEARFNGTHNYLYCNNCNCALFLHPHGYLEKDKAELSPAKGIHPKPFNLSKPSYLNWLEKRKERYRLARSFGFNPIKAMELRGKTMKEIRKLAQGE